MTPEDSSFLCAGMLLLIFSVGLYLTIEGRRETSVVRVEKLSRNDLLRVVRDYVILWIAFASSLACCMAFSVTIQIGWRWIR
jgi:hypothetical protein